MTTWTTIPNTAVAAGGRPRGSVITALRDNPVAIAEGAAGAPRVAFAAIRAGIAAEPHGQVGTYGFFRPSDNIATGATVAGSTLGYSSAINQINISGNGNLAVGSFGSPSGSWKCMGFISVADSTDVTGSASTLFLRIA